MDGVVLRTIQDEVWILEDEPGPAELVVDLCAAADVTPRLFRTAAPLLRALRTSAPSVIVLDWRVANELSAPLFLAVRHRWPVLPVIYWTASVPALLPEMILHDPLTRVVEKTAGIAAFEDALAWGLYATDQSTVQAAAIQPA